MVFNKQMNKGTVIAVSPIGQGAMPEKNCVLMNWIEGEHWFMLADNVQISWVKKGPCEFSLAQDKQTISFLKSTLNQSSSSSGGASPAYPSGRGFTSASDYGDRNHDIRAQMLTKAAIQLIGIHNDYVMAQTPKELTALIQPTKENIIVAAMNINHSVDSIKNLLKSNKEQTI